MQDADFIDEEPRQKKSKKDKKDKKSRERPVEVDPSLSVAERAEKVKQTLEEYTALDHEDIVSEMQYLSSSLLSCRLATSRPASSTREALPSISA